MPLDVIGAGCGRTGTASLKIALEMLGLGPCHHMSEVASTAGQMDLWLGAAAGKPDWDAIYSGYRSAVDFPTSFYWRELADYFPKAKVLLSLRDAERWFASTQNTIFSKRMNEAIAGSKWQKMIQATIHDHMGGDPHDREKIIAAFNAHNDAVKAAFGPERLLVWEPGDGWAPICAFLGVDVPEEPFPRVNSSAEFAGVFEMLASPIGARIMNGDGAPDGPMHDELFKG